MAAIVVRVVILAAGLGLAEDSITAMAAEQPFWPIQLGLALLLVVAGSAGFIVPLLGGTERVVRSDG